MNEQKYISCMLDRTLRCFKKDDVEKVRNTTFAISGLGGVGAITAELLARWGVKKFRLLDMDKYDETNLNRQLFASSNTIGRFKVDVSEERIKEINPYAEVELKIPDRVDNENVHRFVQGADFLIQNADHPSCKLFYLAARKHKVPLVNGYATITGGRVQVFDFRNSNCSHFLEPLWTKLKHGDSRSLEEYSKDELIEYDRKNVHPTAPSINFVVNMVGCLITAEAIKLITGNGKNIKYPEYLYFDMFSCKTVVRNTHSILNIDNWLKIKSLFLRK